MDKYEKRQLRSAAFKKHLREELVGGPDAISVVLPNPVAELAPNLDTPIGAYRTGWDAKYAEGARGISGTGTPIRELSGAAADSATRANLGDGPKVNGGRGQAGGSAALRSAGTRNAAIATAGWAAMAGIEMGRTMGPPVMRALERANQDVRAAELAEQGDSEA
jgi:hypothetical protein